MADGNFQIGYIISGGQTGVDRAALDCAIAHCIPHGGWCPAGRLAEDGVINDRYALSETRENDYQVRTRMNVQKADGTLILAQQPLQGGTSLTAVFARQLQKPYLVIDPVDDKGIPAVMEWLGNHAIGTLNVAGPRASKQPDIYEQAYRFLDRLFTKLSSGTDAFQVR